MKRVLPSIFAIVAMFFLNGCGTTSNLCPAPDGQTSAICELSNKMNTTPESLSQTLQVVNFGALTANVYTAQKADDFVDGLLEDLETIKAGGGTISYLQAIAYINKKFNLLPPEIQVLFVIINPANIAGKEINLPLSPYDIDLLIGHLKQQKVIIGVYL